MPDEANKPEAYEAQPASITKKGTREKASRTKMTGKKAATKKEAQQSSPSKAPWVFPKNTLEEALVVPKALEEKFAGHETKAVELVRAVGFKKSTDWRFQDLLKSSAMYGLTEGSGPAATVRLLELGEDIVAPDLPQKRQRALLDAFRKVPQFKEVEEFYKGKKIPEDEFFSNTLTRRFDVPRDRVETFIQVFTQNVKYLRAFRASREEPAAEPTTGESSPEEQEKRELEEVREFLDTCFVMMPFGEWFDRYYKEIYVPAIKEAGFEPVRADELFSTGSVVEQIWEQIEKSTVMLADLTGKNPNVFYELGLAHAARKPVVFTTGSLDDVPFDLRHLRVIPYEIREPDWNAKLKQSVTAYLKNAKADPQKSIPQPFRDIESNNAIDNDEE